MSESSVRSTKGTTIRQHVFVVSTGRTGSLALAQYLDAAFEGVTAVHEPKPSRFLRIAANAHLAGKISDETATRLFLRARQHVWSESHDPIFVESNPFLVGLLDVFGQACLDPRVIHVVRDPRTWVRSVLNFGSRRGIKRIAARVVPYWVVKPEQLTFAPQRPYRKMTHVEWLSWYWQLANQHLRRGSELYGDDYLLVRYEELFRKGGDGIRTLARWIGLSEREDQLDPLLKIPVNTSRSDTVPHWPAWSDKDRNVLLKHCGELMEELGFDTEEPPCTSS